MKSDLESSECSSEGAHEETMSLRTLLRDKRSGDELSEEEEDDLTDLSEEEAELDKGSWPQKCTSCLWRSRYSIRVGIAVVLVLSGFVAFAVVFHQSPSPPASSSPSDHPRIEPNDLWGVHDLLMVGYAAVFIKPDSAGQRQIQSAALNLTKLLADIHPVAPCRTELKSVNTETGAALVAKRALQTWSCLPHHFTPSDFSKAFDEPCLHDNALAAAARMPKVLPGIRMQLTACEGSRWDRTCSFWSTIHTITLRAEAVQTSSIIPLLLMVLWGGVTQCGG